jgi:ParB family chromosome partitioning protein
VAKEKFSLKGKLPSVDDLFKTDEDRADDLRERVMDIPLSEISDFANHPFKVKMDAEMAELVDSIRLHGVLVPGLVRPKDGGGYEMVAGHRRKMACELARRSEMPCIVRDLTDDEATVIMVDSNLQREIILPSEKAFAYKMKLEAMKRQGQRTDLTSTPLAGKLKGRETAEIIGEAAGDSKDQVRRYIHLTDLIPELLELVDNSVLKEKDKPQIALRPAVELSYLKEEQQVFVLEAIRMECCTPSHAQALLLREKAENNELTMHSALEIMRTAKPNQVEQFKLPKDKISRFFTPDTPAQEIESTIITSLELLQRFQQDEFSRFFTPGTSALEIESTIINGLELLQQMQSKTK